MYGFDRDRGWWFLLGKTLSVVHVGNGYSVEKMVSGTGVNSMR